MTNVLRTIQFNIKMGLVAFWCAIATIVFYILSFPYNGRPWLSWAYAQMLNFGVSRVLQIKTSILGRENMIEGPAVVIMNHQSNFDPLLQGPVFPKNAVIIGKKELLKIPLWGRIFRTTNNILVDRGADNKANSGVEKATQRLQQDDCYIWIFPEGTRSQGKAMGQFKRGAFIMAIDAQVPIVPMISKPLHYVLDVPNKTAKGGHHEIKILPAIDTKGMTRDDLSGLIERCEQLYAQHISEYLACEPQDVFAARTD